MSKLTIPQKMQSKDYELILIAYPENYDISKLREIKYNISKTEDTVIPMDKNVYQNLIPLANNDRKMTVVNPFVDGVHVVTERKDMSLEDREIDFYHSTKEPKYHCVDWRNITVTKEPQWPVSLFDYEPYKKQVLSKKLAKENEIKEKKEKKEEKDEKKEHKHRHHHHKHDDKEKKEHKHHHHHKHHDKEKKE